MTITSKQGKMLQRAASNVSDKAKNSKPKVGEKSKGNISVWGRKGMTFCKKPSIQM